jgi:hypothetical protein
MANVFITQARGFGDDENEWQNIGAFLSLRAARQEVVELQKKWDKEMADKGETERSVRRGPHWQATYRYEALELV